MTSIILNWVLLFSTTFLYSGKLLNSYSGKHPYYVSVTEVNHNAKDKIVEISCKIFTTDLETLLRQKTNSYVDILHPKDKVAMGKMIFEYIGKHLEINLDGKTYQMEYLGYEIEEEGVWSYLQIKNIPIVRKVKITDTILYDYKNEQINMMHVSVNGERKSSKVTRPETTAFFEF